MKKGGEQMNENYLLHNGTAKKLYFEYAKDLPIISLCSDFEADDKIYSNIAEAFLTNDCYKLDAMRAYGVDEKYITGNASDYEKFKAFCSILPKFAGHPIYLLSHIELKKNFDCELSICEDNSEKIWQYCNSKITTECISDNLLMQRSKVSFVDTFHPFIFNEIHNPAATDLKSIENNLLNMISLSDKRGCRIAIAHVIDKFVKPNPYQANEIINKIKRGDTYVTPDEIRLLNMQIYRTLGIEYVKRHWSLIWCTEDFGANEFNDDEALSYLKDNDALPPNYNLVYIDVEETETVIAERIFGFARKNILGKFIFLPSIISPATAFANVDYTRRIICNIIGKWVENGEYTSDEKTLKKLIEDILYNNIKEAIM
jgi:glucuronate isomerase